MKLVIPGESGQLGRVLARTFCGRGDEVVLLSRSGSGYHGPGRCIYWDGRTAEGDWVRELDRADVVINLAGRSVNCRYHRVNRDAIMRSRVESTRAVGKAIASVDSPPRVWLQMSTATIYAHRFDAGNDETTGGIGGDEPGIPEVWRFSIDVARAWEAATREVVVPDTRVVLLRSAMVMSPDKGGVFDTLLSLVRMGLGGRSGSGQQYVSWIHEADFVRAIDWIVERDGLAGAVNLASPNPLTNREFMAALRKAWGIGFGLPSARWMLEIGALFMGTETELILKSRRVVPGALLKDGFEFEYEDWKVAARELCERWRRETVS